MAFQNHTNCLLLYYPIFLIIPTAISCSHIIMRLQSTTLPPSFKYNSSRTHVRLGAWFWSAKADIFFSESLHILAERLSQSEIELPLRKICYYSPLTKVGVSTQTEINSLRIISSAIALCWLSALTHAIWSTGQKPPSIIKSWVLIFLKFFERKFIVISSQKEQSVSRCTLSRTKHFCWRFLLSLFHPFIFLYSGHFPDGNHFRSNLLIFSL